MSRPGAEVDGWYRALGHMVDEVVFVHREDRSIVFVSPSVQDVLGYTPEQFTSLSTPDLIHPDDLPGAAETAVWLRAEPGRSYRSELRVHHADRGWVWVEIVGRNLLHDPEVEGVVNTLRDVSERRAHHERLQHQAHHDALTGLANRTLVVERLTSHLAGPEAGSAAVLMFDLDGFKQVNDGSGHAAGDHLLQVAAERLRGAVRDHDLPGRLGGDEFVVVCRGMHDDASLLDLAARVHQAVQGPVALGERRLDLRLSLGAARAGAQADAGRLLAMADEALYVAKRDGGSAVRLAEPR
jgi:diguanylate cyclase (GGDEF)-like protein/PAS domain S-box-containing protein